jgi:hypothetical protein
MLWTFQPAHRLASGISHDPGRVFGCILGHYSWTFDDPIFRIVFLRGLAWAGRCPFDRFVPLVTDGVKFRED